MYHTCLLLYISSYSISAAHHSLVFLPAPCYAPAICNVKRYRARPWMILLLLGGCVRGEAAPVPHFAPLRPGAGYIALSRRRGSALYTLRL